MAIPAFNLGHYDWSLRGFTDQKSIVGAHELASLRDALVNHARIDWLRAISGKPLLLSRRVSETSALGITVVVLVTMPR
ncbi:hypothetical protein C0V97_05055 [Asaia sp. W19]|nr:hypothetical protein C0V97_05055 [Asaia sp. W19]